MRIHVDKVQTKNRSYMPDIAIGSNKSIGNSSGFTDYRQSTVQQMKLQDMSNISNRAGQLKIPSNHSGPIQRHVNVTATPSIQQVTITANGQAREFQGGDAANNNGWNGVQQYRATAQVGSQHFDSGTLSNNYEEAQAGHVLANQNGGKGSDPNNVFAQAGGVNNGTYRSAIENPMRAALNAVPGDTAVTFNANLYGVAITKGALSKKSDRLHVSKFDDMGLRLDAAHALVNLGE